MKSFLAHLKTYLLRGLLAIIPIAITLAALQFLYVVVDKRVSRLFEQYVGFAVPGLGVLVVLVILYLLGLFVSNAFGRQFIRIIEGVAKRVPLVNTTYQVGKQLASTLSLPERQVFSRAVLVEYFRADFWMVGFVTGSVQDSKRSGEMYLKVFIPTAPNPTSGFVALVKESQTRETGWTIDEALKVVISGGILGPTELR